jgi:outer membrane protein assembly factor BamD (BamD/ComL family)
MSKKGRKLTKEELEQDPLLSFYARVQQFYQQYRSYIFTGLAAVIIVMAGSVYLYYQNQAEEEKAQQLLGFAERHFRNGEYQQALTGQGSDFTIGLENIMQQYSGTKASNLSHYYAAVCEYKLGNTKQALIYIQDFNNPEGILGVGPISFHAMLLNDMGQYLEAAQMYEKAAKWSDNETTTPFNLYKAANAYFEAGNYERARQLADRVINEFSQSDQVAQARKLKGRVITASS